MNEIVVTDRSTQVDIWRSFTLKKTTRTTKKTTIQGMKTPKTDYELC